MWITFWFGKTAIKIRKEKTPFSSWNVENRREFQPDKSKKNQLFIKKRTDIHIFPKTADLKLINIF